jgi:hypothetical protein
VGNDVEENSPDFVAWGFGFGRRLGPMHQEFNLQPFSLLLSQEKVLSQSFLFPVETRDNDTNKEVHDKEGTDHDEKYKKDRKIGVVFVLWGDIYAFRGNTLVHDLCPADSISHLKKCDHGL